MDSAIRQLIWNGSIPLEIHINDPEIILTSTSNTNTSNLPFYVSKTAPHFSFSHYYLLDDGEEINLLANAD